MCTSSNISHQISGVCGKHQRGEALSSSGDNHQGSNRDAKLTGTYVWLSTGANDWLLSECHNLQSMKNRLVSYENTGPLTEQTHTELMWWIQTLIRVNVRAIKPKFPDITIFTDASTWGWELCRRKWRSEVPGTTESWHFISAVWSYRPSGMEVFRSINQTLGTSRGRFVRHEAVNSATEILQLETRTWSRESGCISAGLGISQRICPPPLVLDIKVSEKDQGSTSNNSLNHTQLVCLTVVSDGSEDVSRLPKVPPSARILLAVIASANPPHTPVSPNLVPWLISGDPSMIKDFHHKLKKSSWRKGTHKNYDSVWRKWEQWKHASPISSSLKDILFLKRSVPCLLLINFVSSSKDWCRKSLSHVLSP